MVPVRTFMEQFADEAACRDLIIRLRWPNGFVCPICAERQSSYIKSRQLYECTVCRTQTSVTSGTIMHRTKLPLRYWMLLFYWVASGEQCSARKVSQVLMLNYRTALRMLNAVREAMRTSNGYPGGVWTPVPEKLLRRVNRMVAKRTDWYIRKFYKKVSARNRSNYDQEYRFRLRNGYDPGLALEKLLKAGAAPPWFRPRGPVVRKKSLAGGDLETGPQDLL